MHPVVLSGIRPSFPGLSQSAGQITHVLLTRSPLEHPKRAFPFDLHVLSTPPAFVLSQDQTLQTKTIQRNLTKSPNVTKKPHPTTGTARCGKNKQQTKTTKHTIEFSNNTPVRQATLQLYSSSRQWSNLRIDHPTPCSATSLPARFPRLDSPSFRQRVDNRGRYEKRHGPRSRRRRPGRRAPNPRPP
jgi:hypothetical protein